MDSKNQEVEEYKKRLTIIEDELKNIKDKEEHINISESVFEKYRHIDKLSKDIVDEFVDVIKVGKVDHLNTRDIDIHLNIINLD